MKFKSLSDNPIEGLSLAQAIRHALAPDATLLVPEQLPAIPAAFFNNIASMTLPEIGYVVANMLFGPEIDSATIKEIVYEAFNYDMPLRQIEDGVYELDLTQGPTRNYNDFSARFFASLVKRLRITPHHNIVAATSNSAGLAVASAFAQAEATDIYIIYPAEGLSRLRADYLRRMRPSVHPVEVDGTFDECVAIMTSLLADSALQDSTTILTANSINIGILLPRVIYFFYAYARLGALGRNLNNVTIATPSQHLGNLTAAVIARQMGLPVSRFKARLTDSVDAAEQLNEVRINRILRTYRTDVKIEPDYGYLRPGETVIAFRTDSFDTNTPQPVSPNKQRIVRCGPSPETLRRIIANQQP